MRIIGGEFGSRRLVRPPPGVRPTSDRVRESVFGRLGVVGGQRVLDLYAGTGALAIEALSRGAKEAVFVDRAPGSLRVIRQNLSQLGLDARSQVLAGDATRWAHRLGSSRERFDLIFVDPPYSAEEVGRALSAIVEADLLSCRGTLVVETAKRHPLAATPGLSVLDERCYGDTRIHRLVRDSQRAGGGKAEAAGKP
jgi:16S rRNA (guanine966-N2)-methyltransferase